MNDKKQLAAMGERLAEQQPLCMAKRIEELEAQVRVMAELLRRGRPIIDERADFGLVAGRLLRDIDAALAGKMPVPVVPEGWQRVPVKLTKRMDLALESYLHSGRSMRANMWKDVLAAAAKPEAK